MISTRQRATAEVAQTLVASEVLERPQSSAGFQASNSLSHPGGLRHRRIKRNLGPVDTLEPNGARLVICGHFGRVRDPVIDRQIGLAECNTCYAFDRRTPMVMRDMVSPTMRVWPVRQQRGKRSHRSRSAGVQ